MLQTTTNATIQRRTTVTKRTALASTSWAASTAAATRALKATERRVCVSRQLIIKTAKGIMLAIIFEYYANPVLAAICVNTVFTNSVHGDRLQSVNKTDYLQLQRRYAEKNNFGTICDFVLRVNVHEMLYYAHISYVIQIR